MGPVWVTVLECVLLLYAEIKPAENSFLWSRVEEQNSLPIRCLGGCYNSSPVVSIASATSNGKCLFPYIFMSWFAVTHIILSTWRPFRETRSNSLKEKESSLSPRTLTRVPPSCLLSLAASLGSS